MSTWILLRGLTRETRHWDTFAAQLETALAAQRDAGQAAEPVRVVCLELPGNGAAHRLRSPVQVRHMMEYVRGQALDQGLVAPYRVLAMSLGGMVATAWAQCHTHEVERLVLVNTSMRPWCRVTQRLRPAAWPVLLRLALAWRAPRSVERIVHALTCARTDTLDADLAAWLAWRANAPVRAANACRQLWAAARYRVAQHAPACPTLLLSSAADRLVDPHCSTRIARHWGAPHVRHPWAGHDLPHDDAGWLIATLLQWLTAQG